MANVLPVFYLGRTMVFPYEPFSVLSISLLVHTTFVQRVCTSRYEQVLLSLFPLLVLCMYGQVGSPIFLFALVMIVDASCVRLLLCVCMFCVLAYVLHTRAVYIRRTYFVCMCPFLCTAIFLVSPTSYLPSRTCITC